MSSKMTLYLRILVSAPAAGIQALNSAGAHIRGEDMIYWPKDTEVVRHKRAAACWEGINKMKIIRGIELKQGSRGPGPKSGGRPRGYLTPWLGKLR